MLYPKQNRYRSVYNLNGVWNFSLVSDDYNAKESIINPLLVAVPSSYNDLFCTREMENYVGNVAYEKNFSRHISWDKTHVFLRIGAACHKQYVFINGELVGSHNGGFLPFDIEITSFLKDENRLTIIVDNRLSYETLPIGEVINNEQIYHHDFFNYSGIHRDVLVYTVPEEFIEDIIIRSTFSNEVTVSYEVKGVKNATVSLFDPSGNFVSSAKGINNAFLVLNPDLWDINHGALYKLEVQTENDSYSELFGIRKIEIKEEAIYLNDRRIYLKGFGKHEDFAITGKGNCSAVNIRDFNMMKWINANSFRTSHYPYAEEIMDIADKEGFLVIDEVPAVGFNFWNPTAVFDSKRVSNKTKEVHKNQLTELVNRDKNHPSVILLSIANEAATYEKASFEYFSDVASHARSISPWPIMIVENADGNATNASQFVDVIGINKYNAWYNDHAKLSVIKTQLKADLDKWHERFHKPIIITEFGADTIEGNHSLPGSSFSEEFQVDFLKEFTDAFDELGYISGEHIWNFADFKTKQGLTRVRGNRKGVFTRDRQPKLAAHFVKERWSKR